MNQLISKLAKKSLPLLVAAMAGYCGASMFLRSNTEKIVAEAYEKEAARFRAEFKITCNEDGEPAKIADVISKQYDFKPAKEKVSYLETKVGFKYEVDDTECVETGEKSVIGFPITRCVGSSYVFSVDGEIMGGTSEKLYIRNFTGKSVFPESNIHIIDNDHDGLPDWISVSDSKNNTSMRITKSYKNIEYKNVTEEGAKQLYDLYTLRFNAFKIEHKIDEAILEYSPKLEINEIKPNREKP